MNLQPQLPRRHIYIPDTQVKPDAPTDHLSWIGEYIVEQQPDVIVHAGDHADMWSLSSYDKGKRSHEGTRVLDDIESARDAWDVLNEPIERFNRFKRKNKYTPRKIITKGNHEYRITRHVEENPELYGFLSEDDLGLDRYDWEVHDFLDIVEVDGIHYSHYFVNPLSGRPLGGMLPTRLKNVGFSFTMGHQQIKDQANRYLANGQRQRALVCGSCYLYDDGYRAQANASWHGIFVKNEVMDGDYDLCEVSLDYLCRRYEGITLKEFMKKKYKTTLYRHRLS